MRPARCGALRFVEPAPELAAQRRVAPHPHGERHVGEREPEPRAQVGEAPEQSDLRRCVEAIAGRGARAGEDAVRIQERSIRGRKIEFASKRMPVLAAIEEDFALRQPLTGERSRPAST
jgi:hypothetical protein